MFKKTCTVVLFLFFDLCLLLLAPRIQADILGKARTGWDLLSGLDESMALTRLWRLGIAWLRLKSATVLIRAGGRKH